MFCRQYEIKLNATLLSAHCKIYCSTAARLCTFTLCTCTHVCTRTVHYVHVYVHVHYVRVNVDMFWITMVNAQ